MRWKLNKKLISRLSIFSHLLNLNKASFHQKRNSIDLTIDECLDGDVLPSMENYRESFRNKGKDKLFQWSPNNLKLYVYVHVFVLIKWPGK